MFWRKAKSEETAPAYWAHKKQQKAEDIIAAFEPWTLACAVGSENGSIGRPIGFDLWLHLSRKNWMPEVVSKLGISEAEIEATLRNYVSANRSLHYSTVLKQEAEKRGEKPPVVLGPGKSMTIEVPIKDTAPTGEGR